MTWSDEFTDGIAWGSKWAGGRTTAYRYDNHVNGVKVYEDHAGVGAGWSAYLVLNLSISAGLYHPAPSGTAPITFAADCVRVYR
ncbi:hypothetical protein [Kitasatospora sp. GP82]|uniref:hypothetical protein n=1 Tax=Kitasatospora sp. GP82 TaxID=3035089 RepID=UPI00247524FD|nr:hypothetical protein [Kitasatospora sp. GP82]